MPLLQKTVPDLTSQILGTRYLRFESACGIIGLARPNEDRLDILALMAVHEGRGSFRQFIIEAKQEYRTICIWEVWNPILESALKRYGFMPEKEIQGNGEVVEGWRWDKGVNNFSS